MSRGHARPAARGASGLGAQSGNRQLAKALGLFSIGLGIAELVGARSLCRRLGLHGREGLVRAYGAREIATGVAILTSHDPTPWVWGRVAGDVLDLATLATAFDDRRGNRESLAGAMLAVAAVTALDVVCAQGLTAEKRLPPAGTFDYRRRSGFPAPPREMRGAADDFVVPDDFRIPELLRPWDEGRPAAKTGPSERED